MPLTASFLDLSTNQQVLIWAGCKIIIHYRLTLAHQEYKFNLVSLQVCSVFQLNFF